MVRHVALLALVLTLLASFSNLARCQASPSEADRLASYLDGSLDLASLAGPETGALTSGDPKLREGAVATLVSWLDQVSQGVHSGTIRSTQTPYLNMPWVNRGWNLMVDLPDEFPKKLPDEVAAIADWYLRQDHSRLTAIGMALVHDLEGPRTDALLLSMIQTPPKDLRLLQQVMEEAATRSLEVPRNRLLELGTGYREGLGKAARSLNDHLGYEPIPAPDPGSLLDTPGIRRLMSRLDSLAVDDVPADAPYVQLRFTETWPHIRENRWLTNGWLLAESESSIVLYQPYGFVDEFAKADSSMDKFGELQWLRTIEVTPHSLTDEVERVHAITFWNPDYFRSDATALHNGPWSISMASPFEEIIRPAVFEMILARWLYRNGPRALAASAVLGMIERYPGDEALLESAEVGFGDLVAYRMLDAFVGERDYDRALELARRVVDRYPGNALVDNARELLTQLPGRMDDFRSFRLPTVEEWRDLQGQLNREEQIVYLCDRLRLLNGESGGCISPQFRDPMGLSRDARGMLHFGGPTVINPCNELIGHGEQQGEDLKLTTADIAILAPYLDDDDFVLSVGYPVDGFHVRRSPERWLERVSSVVAYIINFVAPVEICKDPWYGSSPDEQERTRAQEVLDWVDRNRDRTAGEILRENLAKAREPWKRSRLLRQLVSLEGEGATDELMAFVSDSTNAIYFDDMLYLRYSVEPRILVPYARLLLERNPALRLKVAQTLAAAGDEQGFRILREEIEEKGLISQTRQAFTTLLEKGPPEDVALVVSLLPEARDTLLTGEDWGYNLSQLARLGRPEGYKWLLETLEDTTATGSMRSHSTGWVPIRRNMVAAEAFLSSNLVPDSLHASYLSDLSYEGQKRALQGLRDWARQRLSEISRRRK